MANNWDEEKLDPKFEDPTENTEGLARLRLMLLDWVELDRYWESENHGKTYEKSMELVGLGDS